MTKPCAVDSCSKPFLARGYCKSHYRRFMTYGDPEHVISRDMKPAPEGYRVCNTCDSEKLLTEFTKSSRSAGGYSRRCRACSNSYTAKWARANPSKVKISKRKTVVRAKYGDVGMELHHKLASGAVCEACGERRNRMAIDHNHTTGQIRGILCSNCNTALGLLGEDFSRFTSLMEYLKAHTGNEAQKIGD